MNGNIIVNVGDLVLGVILVGRCRGQTRGRGRGKERKECKTRRGKGGQDWARRDDPGPSVVMAGGTDSWR